MPKRSTRSANAIAVLKDAGNPRKLAATYSTLGDVLSGHEEPSSAGEAHRSAAEVLLQVA
jgi:hypothetical protein